MTNILGLKFADKKSEIVDSLFSNGGTVSGYIKRTRRNIFIHNLRGERIGFINTDNVLGSASKIDGKYWYTYGTPYMLQAKAKTLGFAKVKELTESLAIGRDSKGLIFK